LGAVDCGGSALRARLTAVPANLPHVAHPDASRSGRL
jgi:hypothetical protein